VQCILLSSSFLFLAFVMFFFDISFCSYCAHCISYFHFSFFPFYAVFSFSFFFYATYFHFFGIYCLFWKTFGKKSLFPILLLPGSVGRGRTAGLLSYYIHFFLTSFLFFSVPPFDGSALLRHSVPRSDGLLQFFSTPQPFFWGGAIAQLIHCPLGVCPSSFPRSSLATAFPLSQFCNPTQLHNEILVQPLYLRR
jgi:hypothetical protein